MFLLFKKYKLVIFGFSVYRESNNHVSELLNKQSIIIIRENLPSLGMI